MRKQLSGLNQAGRVWAISSVALASILLVGCNQSGTANLRGSSSASSSASLTQSGTADVSWTAPTTNTDGSALTDLAGYRIYYGTSPTDMTKTVSVQSASATDYQFSGLQKGTWYFAVEAYTNTGLDSGLSPTVSKTIT